LNIELFKQTIVMRCIKSKNFRDNAFILTCYVSDPLHIDELKN